MRRTTLRPITEADQDFLLRLYGSTRAQEMAMVPWTDEQKDEFIRFQFDAQSTYYAEQFPKAQFDVVELEGERGGRLYVDRREDEIRLIDICFLPEHCGKGHGSELLDELLAEGEAEELLVRIHVEQENPAMRLYRRLGFEKIEEQGVYWLMEWRPEKHSVSS